MSHRTSDSPRTRSWLARHRTAVIAGLTTFLVAVSGTTGWAYWTSSVAASGSLATQTASVSHSNFNTMGATYLPSALTSTGSFVVTNTGAANGTATVTIAAPEAFASSLPISVWPTSQGACDVVTVPGTAAAGTWAAPPALAPSLNAGASITYCVRTKIPDWKTITSSSGSQSANPVINVSLDADGWVASAASATHVQRTAGMYPLTPDFFNPGNSRWFTIRPATNSTNCLDTFNGGGAGSVLQTWECHQSSNQRWEFVPVSGTNQSFVTIRPRHAMGSRIGYNGAGNALIETASGASSQQWYVQQVGANYQLVNAQTGLCLGMTPSARGTSSTMVACDQPSARLSFNREKLDLSQPSIITGYAAINFNSQLPAGNLQRCDNAACTLTTNDAIANNSTSVSFSCERIPNGTTATFRIVNSANVVLYDNIKIARSGTFCWLATLTPVAGFG